MPIYKYQVVLSRKQRKRLKALSKRGNVSARKLTCARILLLADQNRPQGALEDKQIHDILDVSQATIIRVRKKFVTGGLDRALEELHGYSQWSLRLLADQLVELDVVADISHQTVGALLKKTN